MSSATTIGPYELLEELGRGGMGVVYRARHAPTGALRALKLMTGHADADATARFRREAEALARAGGRGIVPIHDMGVERGHLYFVMSLVPGGSLRQRLRTRGALPWRDAVSLVEALARALARCHGEGLVHRDVKPDNVLLDGEGEPWLADFGLVRDLDASRLTETGTAVGTLAYMSAEQLDGEPVDARTDVFALGALLHECLTGSPLFDQRGLLAQRAARSVPRKPLAIEECPEGLERVLDRALADTRERRTPSAAELAHELEAVRLGVPFKEVTAPRRRSLAVLLALLLVAGAAFAVSSMQRGGVTPPPEQGPRPPLELASPPRELERKGDIALLESRYADARSAFMKAETLGLESAKRRRILADALVLDPTLALDRIGAGVGPVRSENGDLRPFAPLLYRRGLDRALPVEKALRIHAFAWSLDDPRDAKAEVVALWRAFAASKGPENEWQPERSSRPLALEARRRLRERIVWGWRAHFADPCGDESEKAMSSAAAARQWRGMDAVMDTFHSLVDEHLPRENPTLALLEAQWLRRSGAEREALAECLRGLDLLPPFVEGECLEVSEVATDLLGNTWDLWARVEHPVTEDEIERCERATRHERSGANVARAGLAWLKLGSTERARAAYEKCRARSPRIELTYILEHELLRRAGDTKGQLVQARRWVAELGSSWSRYVLSSLLVWMQDWQGVLDMPLDLAADAPSRDQQPYLAHRLLAHWKLGQRTEAENLAKRVPALEPSLEKLRREEPPR